MHCHPHPLAHAQAAERYASCSVPVIVRKRREPEKTLLYQTVQKNFLTFQQRYSELSGGVGLPTHVEREFEEYLKCGILCHGFVRLKCDSCKDESLLGFSCKKRGFCPSCGARKMCEEAAFLRDHVLPFGIPYRQYVLTVPIPLRYRMAKNPKLLGEIHGIFAKEVRRWIESKAKQSVAVDSINIVSGTICFVQRFGDGLRLSPHFHLLAPEGAFQTPESENQSENPEFIPIDRPISEEICQLLEKIQRKVIRRLQRLGNLRTGDESDPVAAGNGFSDEESGVEQQQQVMEAIQQASVENRVVFGNPPGSPVRKEGRNPVGLFGFIGEPAQANADEPLLATLKGFSLHAATFVRGEVEGHDGEGEGPLERLLRYMARGSTPLERMKAASGGDILIQLKKPWRDGTKRIRLNGLELMERLASLVAPRGVNLIRYSGCFAPRHQLRSKIVALSAKGKEQVEETEVPTTEDLKPPGCGKKKRFYLTWMELLRRVYRSDVDVCDLCGGRTQITEALKEEEAITRILRKLGISTTPPELTPPSRAPPGPLFETQEMMQEWAEV